MAQVFNGMTEAAIAEAQKSTPPTTPVVNKLETTWVDASRTIRISGLVLVAPVFIMGIDKSNVTLPVGTRVYPEMINKSKTVFQCVVRNMTNVSEIVMHRIPAAHLDVNVGTTPGMRASNANRSAQFVAYATTQQALIAIKDDVRVGLTWENLQAYLTQVALLTTHIAGVVNAAKTNEDESAINAVNEWSIVKSHAHVILAEARKSGLLPPVKSDAIEAGADVTPVQVDATPAGEGERAKVSK